MTLAQDAFPGNALFHRGWYNAIDAALLIVAAYQPRKNVTALCGCAIIVIAGLASGLMGPDTHTVVGAPGATVNDDQIGSAFVFPLAQPSDDPQQLDEQCPVVQPLQAEQRPRGRRLAAGQQQQQRRSR